MILVYHNNHNMYFLFLLRIQLHYTSIFKITKLPYQNQRLINKMADNIHEYRLRIANLTVRKKIYVFIKF